MPGNKAIRKRHAPRKSFALPPPSQRAHPFRLANIRFFERKAFRRRTYLRRGNMTAAAIPHRRYTAVVRALRKRQRLFPQSRKHGRENAWPGDILQRRRPPHRRVCLHPRDSFHSGGSASQVYGRRRGVAQMAAFVPRTANMAGKARGQATFAPETPAAPPRAFFIPRILSTAAVPHRRYTAVGGALRKRRRYSLEPQTWPGKREARQHLRRRRPPHRRACLCARILPTAAIPYRGYATVGEVLRKRRRYSLEPQTWPGKREARRRFAPETPAAPPRVPLCEDSSHSGDSVSPANAVDRAFLKRRWHSLEPQTWPGKRETRRRFAPEMPAAPPRVPPPGILSMAAIPHRRQTLSIGRFSSGDGILLNRNMAGENARPGDVLRRRCPPHRRACLHRGMAALGREALEAAFRACTCRLLHASQRTAPMPATWRAARRFVI